MSDDCPAISSPLYLCLTRPLPSRRLDEGIKSKAVITDVLASVPHDSGTRVKERMHQRLSKDIKNEIDPMLTPVSLGLTLLRQGCACKERECWPPFLSSIRSLPNLTKPAHKKRTREEMGPFFPELGNIADTGGREPRMASSVDGSADEVKTRMEGVLSGFQFIWQSPNTLEQFVNAANDLSNSREKAPSWISQQRGSITVATFVNDLLRYLAELGGGLQDGDQLVMPNSSTQAYNICRRIGHIEMDPFMQACMKELPEDSHFASVMRLFEDPEINACPVYFVAPPSPFRQLFF